MLIPNINLTGKTILVTGAAGFIGANLVMELLRTVHPVHIVGLDNMNDYYDPALKEYRLGTIEALAAGHPESRWILRKGSIADRDLLDALFDEYRFDIVVNLAAQAGVRYSITNPDVYMESNMIGFFSILEACRSHPVEHLVCAPEKKTGEDGLPVPPYRIYNIGNNAPENLLNFVDILQQELIRAEVLPEDYDFEAHKELVPMQAGDVPVTYADVSALEEDFGFRPSTSLREGLRKFAEWYKEFYRI